jgi:hypothetical protein
MANQAPKCICCDITQDDQFFNWGHSVENPTSASDFEFHLSRWVESNNPGVQVACTLKRESAPHVYVVDIVVLTERSSLFCTVHGRMNISFIVVNGQSMADGYEEFIMKLQDADLTRLDDIVF